MQIAVLGIDLGKNSCSLVALDQTGAVVKRRRMRPESIPAFTQTLGACVVAMEACCGAHHLGRLLAAQGHTVRLMSPETRRRERQMQRFKSARQAQRFLSTHSRIHNHFQLRRHRLSAIDYRTVRDDAFRTWRDVAGVPATA